MDFDQSTTEEILDSEREMVRLGPQRYGEYFVNAWEFNRLLNDFIKSVDPDRFIFAAFLSHVRKHAALAIFSVARLHHVQAAMDIRQVLEAGASAAYAIGNTDIADFARRDEEDTLDPSQELTTKRYAWLDKHYSGGSAAILRMKKSINFSTHANIVDAHRNFNFDAKSGRFETPFFDFEDEFQTKTHFWMIANILMGLMDLFYGVNKSLNVIKFTDDFVARLKSLEVVNHKLKTEMTSSERFRKIKNPEILPRV